MKPANIFTAAVCVAIPMVTGALAGAITGNESRGEWYLALEKPSFQPPGWVFGPVWTTLYFLMGIGLYLVWRSSASRARTLALIVFAVQLVLNFLWSLIFFRWHQLGLAAVEIIVLWVAILAMIVTFWKVHRTAALLQLPYLTWVSFATVLTISIYILNRG